MATFRFYEELNDFLPPERRKVAFAYAGSPGETVKHAVEALGVPHTEVELLLVNGESVGFSYLLREDDYVSVYPKFEALDITPLLKVRERPLRIPRFIADCHLGGLAKTLRLLGFDTLYRNDYSDEELAAIAHREGRVVLTRDRGLLMHKAITHGCYVRALKTRAQLVEVLSRLDLYGNVHPFSRCLRCNEPLAETPKEAIAKRLPPKVAAHHEAFWTCPQCHRLYWAGSHWERMSKMIGEALQEPAAKTHRR